nr:ATP-binding protein [uncultured Prevotella sp.]
MCTREEKKVIFIDEIPWLDTPRSGFLSALEYFWNSFASARKDVLLIICGSATSWIINKVLKNHGGLHNRVTYRIHLQPFTLYECKQYAKYLGMRASHYDLIEYYMILGGVAFYWSRFDKGLSVAQNIDNMIFSETGFLHNEFNELYDSLFNEPESYLKIIHALGTIRMGMTRDELVKEGGITSNGKLTRTLEDLTECGFIKRIPSYGGKAKDDLIQLVDNFTIFYYKYMKENLNNDEHFWSNSYNSTIRSAWTGLAFERVCFQHIPQIKQAMGIAGVATQCYSWKAKGDALSSGTQIDMVLDRRDNIINICEMKFSKGEYTITKDYAMALNNKVERFIESTKNKKTILLTMITTNGVVHNEYWNQIQCDITTDELFNA